MFNIYENLGSEAWWPGKNQCRDKDTERKHKAVSVVLDLSTNIQDDRHDTQVFRIIVIPNPYDALKQGNMFDCFDFNSFLCGFEKRVTFDPRRDENNFIVVCCAWQEPFLSHSIT